MTRDAEVPGVMFGTTEDSQTFVFQCGISRSERKFLQSPVKRELGGRVYTGLPRPPPHHHHHRDGSPKPGDTRCRA
eukprot:7409787-Pyramimonas_sp.AAC.1